MQSLFQQSSFRRTSRYLIAASVLMAALAVSPAWADQASIDKSTCNQSSTGPVEKTIQPRFWKQPLYDNPSLTFKSSSGRVLCVEPLVIEEPGSPFVIPSSNVDKSIDTTLSRYTRSTNTYFVCESEREKLKSLKFGDRITFDLHPVMYDAGELAMGTVVSNIRTAGAAPQTPHLLISYHPLPDAGVSDLERMYNSNRQLIIYNNGHAFYHDDMNYVMELQLSDKELRDVLKTFGDANFDSLPSNIALLQLSPCILLACNRLQIVDLSKYGTQAQAVVKSLNSIKQQILNSAVHRLGYARRYQIVEWPYASILELGNRRFEAMSDRNKRLKNLTVPPQLFAAIKQGVAYESADKLYLVSLGNYNGDHPANEPKSLPTWTSFWENEVSPDRVKQFPPETGINLANVPAGGADNGPAGGITLSKTQYDNHRQFFESLPHWPNPGGRQPFWMQNGYLYLGLHIQLENPK